MQDGFDPIRYSRITDKNRREIVMLRGFGCQWRRCKFCDYHFDCSDNAAENFALNKQVLDMVSGCYARLEVINSGSFTELDPATIDYIKEVCVSRKIEILHFECHWMHRAELCALREEFRELDVTLKIKTGVETFDYAFRESVLDKGIDEKSPKAIAEYFDECCLLQGIAGQTAESMRADIEIGLKNFERVCVNIMQENSCPIKPDARVIEAFMRDVFPQYRDNPRVDILLNNTDFGVGGESK